MPCNRMSNSGYKMIRTPNRDWYLHRMLAVHFIPNPKNKPQVNHIDGDKLNNSLENLEWVTKSENMRHAFDTGLAPKHSKTRNVQTVKNGLKSPTMIKKKLWTGVPITWCKQDGTPIEDFKDIYDAGRLPSKRSDRIRNNILNKYRFGDKTFFKLKNEKDMIDLIED